MPTVYPGALDAFTNPTATSALDVKDHAGDHANALDAIEAIEGELGVNPSGVAATVAARLATIEASGFLRFVPVNRITVFNAATTAVSIATTTTAAIASLPADAVLASGYLEIVTDVAANNGNYMGVFHSGGGASGFAALCRAVMGATLSNNMPFTAKIEHSSGRKLLYTVNRTTGTITYSIFVTGYWTALPA
jgi:hypothetical protein